jgi:hypothetical protein
MAEADDRVESLNEAFFEQLTGGDSIAESRMGDALAEFTRSLMYRTRRAGGCVVRLPRIGYLQMLMPPIPVDAPWWETGWPLYEVIWWREGADRRLASMSPLALWYERRHEERRRRYLHITDPPMSAKVDASLAVAARLLSQIRSLGPPEPPAMTPPTFNEMALAGLADPEGRDRWIGAVQDYLRMMALEEGLYLPGDPRRPWPYAPVGWPRGCAGTPLATVLGVPIYESDFTNPAVDFRCRLRGRVRAIQAPGARGFVAAAEYSDLLLLRSIVAGALAQKGDDVCWRDLYNPHVAGLAGVEDFDPTPPPRPRFLANCGHFHDCLADGRPYVADEAARAAYDAIVAADGDPDADHNLAPAIVAFFAEHVPRLLGLDTEVGA